MNKPSRRSTPAPVEASGAPAIDSTFVAPPAAAGGVVRPVARAGVVSLAAATLALFAVFVAAWEDRPAVVVPADTTVVTAAQPNLYALLARGFLHGRLALDAAPPPALLAAANPYAPADRAGIPYLHDVSLFRGRYHLYFGPAPAVLLFLPWRILTGIDLPAACAVMVFVGAAYLGLLALVRWIGRHHYPTASRGAQWAALVAMSGATFLLPLARRPAAYEVAIACGVAAMTWGLYCACRARTAARPLAWCAGTGLLFGVVVASRPNLGLAAVAGWLIISGDSSHRLRLAWDRRVLTTFISGALIVGCVGLYNQARFGSPFEFGQRYQLSSIAEGAAEHFSLRYLPAQLWFYFFAPLEFTAWFPFVATPAAGGLPTGFWAHEFSFGLLTNVPVLWFAAGSALAVIRGRETAGLLLALTLGAAAVMVPLLLFFGSAVRYQAEFTPLLMLLAAAGIMEIDAHLPVPWRAAAGRLALALATASGAVVTFATVDMYNGAFGDHPRLFDGIGHILNRPALAWRALSGDCDGPLRFSLRLLDAPVQRGYVAVIQTSDGGIESVALEPAGAAEMRIIVARAGPEHFHHAAVVSAGAARQTHELAISMSSLFPNRAIELPQRMEREDFHALKMWLRVEWDGRLVLEESVTPRRWHSTAVKTTPVEIAAAGFVPFHGDILSVARGPALPWNPAERLGGVRLRVRWDEDANGRSFPLGVSGHAGSGNLLFLTVTGPREVRFGYDHWGKPMLLSSPLKIDPRHEHVIEFWMPSYFSTQRSSALVVRVDGQTVWHVPVPFHPAGARELFVARNPIGGTSCEPDFPFARIEATNLPPYP